MMPHSSVHTLTFLGLWAGGGRGRLVGRPGGGRVRLGAGLGVGGDIREGRVRRAQQVRVLVRVLVGVFTRHLLLAQDVGETFCHQGEGWKRKVMEGQY